MRRRVLLGVLAPLARRTGKHYGKGMRQPRVVSIAIEHARQMREQSELIARVNLRRPSVLAALFSVRFVAHLSDEVVAALGANTSVRMVRVAPSVLKHITDSRKKVSQADVDLAVGHLSECVERLEFLVQPQRKGKNFELVAFIPSKKRYLRAPLKFVPAAASKSNEDEWWVQTAIPLSATTVRALLAAGKLRRLFEPN